MKYIPGWLRSIVLGWLTLLAIAYLVEGPLMAVSAPLFGAGWIATVHLALDCCTLAAAGWVAGRVNRPRSVFAGALFAVTLCIWNFQPALALDVPWLVRVIWNSMHDTRYLEALLTSVEVHVILFGCLLAGARLGRAREKPVSILA